MSQPVSQAISPLRQRMLEDMTMRGLREDTQRDYIRFVRSFAGFLKCANWLIAKISCTTALR